MAKAKTPSFVLTVEMITNESIQSKIESESEDNRVMYNTCLGELLKRERQMKRLKFYKKIKRCLRVVSKKLSYYEETKQKEKIDFYRKEKDVLMKEIFSLQDQFGLSEYSMHEFAKPIRFHFGNRVNSAIAQKTATRAWNTFKKKLTGDAKRVNFVKREEMDSFEGKTNKTGWVFKNNCIVYEKYQINLKLSDKDIYIKEALSYIDNKLSFTYKNNKDELKQAEYKVKYVRIVKKIIRGKVRYFAQLIVQGFPPPKRKKDGSFRHTIGKGRVGGDLGISSIAVVGEKDVILINLADKVQILSRQIRVNQRKMDRSRRETNPKNYNEDGTITKGKKTWFFSKHYNQLKAQLKELLRKQAVIRKLSHQQLANKLLSFGDEHYWEDMNMKALQKRAKNTEISEKTGKFKRKKRFGKSIGHRAPAMFLSILEDKVKAHGGTFKKANTKSFKASQYDHISNEYKKKKLRDRWHVFDNGIKIQRDLYSAFLLRNSNKAGTKTNRKMCIQTFGTFQVSHDNEVKRIEQMDIIVLNSGIKIKNK